MRKLSKKAKRLIIVLEAEQRWTPVSERLPEANEMSVSEHANYLLNEYGRLQFDYAAYCKPDGESLRNEARNNLETYIAELEDAQRWIPVSERLPECEKDVLVFWGKASDGSKVDWFGTARIAELEGKLAELIEAADKMYDVTEYILGGDTVEMFYCREIAEEARDVLKGE